MSWLNLNDSLNNLKGQISHFASNVLADENTDSNIRNGRNSDIEELQKVCTQQQQELDNLRKLNEELSRGKGHFTLDSNGFGFNQSDANWAWEVSDVSKSDNVNNERIISDLKKTISELENEKRELTASLDLLDSDYQLNTEKLVGMKDKLQADYNKLEDKYHKLKENNLSLLESQQKDRKELEEIKLKCQELMETSSVSGVTSEKTCSKCETLLEKNQKFMSEIDSLKTEISVLNSNNTTLNKILEDSKADDNLKDKLKLCESENKILIGELQKATQSIAAFEKKREIDAENCKKLAFILEGYEQQVSSLKEDLVAIKNEKESYQKEANLLKQEVILLKEENSKLNLIEDVEKLKNDLRDIQEQLKVAVDEKEQVHKKYVSILTENVKKYLDCDKPSVGIEDSTSEIDPQISEFSHQVESILNILLELKCKCVSLENDLYNVTQEKTNLLTEKNHEIEKLLQNSEILSQEVITKSQTIKDYESECNELMKNNDILINELEAYKNNSGLQTISESNEDNLLLLESQLENANKRIEELENIIAKMESSTSTEPVSEESEMSYQNLITDFNQLKIENLTLKKEVQTLEALQETVDREKESLNQTLEKVKTDLENTEYQYTEININMESLREEIENQRKKIADLMDLNTELEQMNTEYERTNEDIRSELNVLREKLLFEEESRKQLENQVRNLTEKLQNAKMCETSLKLQYDTINKELIGVTEAKLSAEKSLEDTLARLTQCQENVFTLQCENGELKNFSTDLEEKLKILQEKLELEEKKPDTNFDKINLEANIEDLKEENSKLSTNLRELKLQLDEVIEKNNNLETQIATITNQHSVSIQNIAHLEKQIEELNSAKNELTKVIITKHQENVTYHNEIQRLTQILNVEVEKAHNLELHLATAKNTAIDNTELEKKNEELEKLKDQNNFLRQKCEVLAENLLQEQSKVQQILAERAGPSDKEVALSKKLERLQTHLIEVEEHYTQELLRAEEKNAELQAKVNEVEQREKNSSTMYTSVSIRANQHVETLQHQLQLITNQRDELRKKISDAEDHANKQEAALANLQFVLEQFQKDKENDVLKETERIRRQVNAEKRIQEDLKKEIANLQGQLEESKQGLQAASRLSDQLEQSKQLTVTLKGEVSQLKEKLNKTEEQLKNLSSQTDGKVEKSLIKNLIIGFITTNNNMNKDQMQILKIIATVLDFSQQDHDKVSLNKSHQSWLSSFLSPQTSQGMSQESLSQAFVKFLENESKPRLVPSLLSNDETIKSRKNSSAAGSRQSPSILSEVVLPTFADFAQNRNSSSILKDVLKDNS